MKKTNALLAIAAVLASSQLYAAGGFLVAPERAKYDFNKVETKKFILTNISEEPIRLSIKPEFISLDSKFINVGKHTESYLNDDDLTKYVRVAPRIVNLGPGERRDVRVQVRPDSKLTSGEYRTHLLVLEIPTEQDKPTSDDASDDIAMNIALRMETAIALYGVRGEYEEDLIFKCKTQNNKNELTITNNSNYMFEGKILMGENIPLPTLVMRESSRTITLDEAFKQLTVVGNESEISRTVDCSK